MRHNIAPAQHTLFASPSLVGAARGERHAEAYCRATRPARRKTSTLSASVASPLAHAQASCGTSTGAGAGRHRNAACSTRLIRSQRPFSSLRSLANKVPASTTARKHVKTSRTVLAGDGAPKSAGRTMDTAAAPPASASSSTISLNLSKSGKAVGTGASPVTAASAGGGSAASLNATDAFSTLAKTSSARASDVANAARPRDAACRALFRARSSIFSFWASARPQRAMVTRVSTTAAKASASLFASNAKRIAANNAAAPELSSSSSSSSSATASSSSLSALVEPPNCAWSRAPAAPADDSAPAAAFWSAAAAASTVFGGEACFTAALLARSWRAGASTGAKPPPWVGRRLDAKNGKAAA
mmetsp:Transcript_3447/g.10633  ORF Transcript_3447/g.10633 Transcript_3447/m.10633 type:complete len:359 (-) Transcript_3447:754-1830(-)